MKKLLFSFCSLENTYYIRNAVADFTKISAIVIKYIAICIKGFLALKTDWMKLCSFLVDAK